MDNLYHDAIPTLVNTEDGVKITAPLEPNTEIWISDSTVFVTWRKKPFTWIQRKLISWCFGLKVVPR